MKKTGIGLVDYARSKVGTPYFYGSKMKALTETFMQTMHKQYPSVVTLIYMAKARSKGQVGKICTDCSGLIGGYREKQIGSAQLYQTAYTRLPINEWEHFANGVVLWRSGHVGVFFWDGNTPKVIEAKGINYGTVISDFDKSKWTNGLTFSDMEYVYEVNLAGQSTWKQANPYTEPVRTLYKGLSGDDVRWLQFELIEAGYRDIIMAHGGIDGDFGKWTYKCVGEFQKSCKLKQDYRVGPATRAALKAQ